MKQASETSDTLISRLSTPCALDDFDGLAIEGADAVAFAQAQLASDVAALAVGHWQWTCLLTPQGRVLVLGILLRPSPERLLLLAPGARAAELAEALRRFVLRRRVVLSAVKPAVRGEAGGEVGVAPRSGGPLRADGPTLRIELGGVAGRVLAIDAEPVAADATKREAWRALDAFDGIPWIEGAAVSAWIPQALGLERLAAFSTRKGCYPGQEIVARTHFLGRNKRQLRRSSWLHGIDAPPPGTRLLPAGTVVDAEAAGEVVFAAGGPAGGALLAVVREDAPPLLRPDGLAVEIALEALPGPVDAGAAAAKML